MFKRLCLTNMVIILFAAVFFTPPQLSYADYDSFTVNIPNSQGGYTSLDIRKSGNRYIGPRGEYYSSFPTVYQLQAVYDLDEAQREKMIEQQADGQVWAQQQRMIRQQQLLDQQIQQNIQQQRAQQQTQQNIRQQQFQAESSAFILKTQAQPKQNPLVPCILVLFFSLLGITGLAVYFSPSIIAKSRKHKNFTPILLVNIFLGWTFLGWVAALVWSFSSQERK